MSDRAAGITYGEHGRRDVVNDDRPGTDNGVVADSDSRHDNHVSAKPDIIANGDGQRVFEPSVTLLDIERVSGGVESAVGSNKHVVAKRDPCLVEYYEVGVCEEVLTHFDIEAIVAEEGLQDVYFFPCFPKNSAYESVTLVELSGPQLIIIVAQIVALVKDFEQRLIVGGIIKVARHHLLDFTLQLGVHEYVVYSSVIIIS